MVLLTHKTPGGEIDFFSTILRDITRLKQAEIFLQHANRALSTMSAVNSNLIHAINEDELLQSICQVIVEQSGYQMAWVGYVQHDEEKSIKIMAHAGHGEGYLDATQFSWADRELDMRPSGRAVLSGITHLSQDIANDPLFQPWCKAALKSGYAANIALALKNENGEVFGILSIYAEEEQAFTANEISLLEEMAGDLAFGVRSLNIRHERDIALVKNQEQLVQLQDSLEDAMRALSHIVEVRDPYTAGHQIRVAELAAAIATQMGLSDEQVHAIHLASTVHDLGKIQVPAEILSKPGKINDLEFGLIKAHAQAGYDILKDIHFPWPIAQMVLQHHERMDGSGYPQGLKGDQIILGARILGVADVVEAMSSHRPYRVGLGVRTALAEINAQRGSLFDPQIVDACLALFRDQHFSFKS
jgi:HD-GYP domain-containing protein (c-di-GMP phosphodiesterase class II)